MSRFYKDQAINIIVDTVGSSRFSCVKDFSFMAMPDAYRRFGNSFDFVFIDGNHMFDHTLLEWFFADRMLKPGGVIGFDDCNWPMVKSVTNFVEANAAYRIHKPTGRTFFAYKVADDTREWYHFKPFEVDWSEQAAAMIADAHFHTMKARSAQRE